MLRRFEEIEDLVGQQSAHAYLARAAAAAGATDQALLLAQASLDLDRRIQDRFGQRITLELQLKLFAQCEDVGSRLATALLLRDLCTSLGEVDRAARYTQLLQQAQQALSPDAWALIEQAPDAVRERALSAARDRLAQAGRSLYDPLP